MAFNLLQIPLSLDIKPGNHILYHCRNDKEYNQVFDYTLWNIPNLVVDDWVSYQWTYRENLGDNQAWYWQIPGIVRLVREGWQKGLSNPPNCFSRLIWQRFHPYGIKLSALNNASLHQQSWGLIHSGIYQFKQYPLIVTNRLHGHILCLLLNIPHIFLPNAYHKNQAFYETWTQEIPWCRFVKDPVKVTEAFQELLKMERDGSY